MRQQPMSESNPHWLLGIFIFAFLVLVGIAIATVFVPELQDEPKEAQTTKEK
ncbi:MAG: hypothetical protein NZM37_04965 [Sandaracinaceae bacterium]|nr:hypothetical protein [Sandaracinaceae bacterium]MDW8245912.1 hypothetical protein [Sandaracinaceae bacterium]